MSAEAYFEVQVEVQDRHVWRLATFNLTNNTLEVSKQCQNLCSLILTDWTLDLLPNNTYLIRHRHETSQLLFRSPRKSMHIEFLNALRACVTTSFWSLPRLAVYFEIQWISTDTLPWIKRQLVLWGNTLHIFHNFKCLHLYNASQCSIDTISPNHIYIWKKDGIPIFRFRCPDTTQRIHFLTTYRSLTDTVSTNEPSKSFDTISSKESIHPLLVTTTVQAVAAS